MLMFVLGAVAYKGIPLLLQLFFALMLAILFIQIVISATLNLLSDLFSSPNLPERVMHSNKKWIVYLLSTFISVFFINLAFRFI